MNEIVRESGGGLLFDSTDQLNDALAKLAADGPLRKELGDKGKCALLACWTESVVVQQYFAIIRRVAEQRGRVNTLKKLNRLLAEQ